VGIHVFFRRPPDEQVGLQEDPAALWHKTVNASEFLNGFFDRFADRVSPILAALLQRHAGITLGSLSSFGHRCCPPLNPGKMNNIVQPVPRSLQYDAQKTGSADKFPVISAFPPEGGENISRRRNAYVTDFGRMLWPIQATGTEAIIHVSPNADDIRSAPL
jgi:hypothetical protein